MAPDAATKHALDEVVDRVVARYPQMDPPDIRARVDQHVAQFEHATVQDFVPVLVEHQILDELRREPG